MKKLLETHFECGVTPTILIAERSTSLVEVTAPATRPSASPLLTIIMLKFNGSFMYFIFASSVILLKKRSCSRISA